MSQENKDRLAKDDWKRQTYITGATLGAFLGFLSAYLFAREAAADNAEEDARPDIPPSVLLGLALSTISLLRQIVESARKEKKK